MKNKTLILIVFLVSFSLFGFGNKIIKAPDFSKGLEKNFNWAKKNIKQSSYIIYSIKVKMCENSHYGSWCSDSKEYTNLGELLTGKKKDYQKSGELSIKKAAKMALDNHKGNYKKPKNKVLRDVAIIFRAIKEGKKVHVSKVSVHTYNSMVKMRDYPVYWLGEFKKNESILFLKNQFDLLKDVKVRKGIVTSIALHRDEQKVKPFLKNIIKNNYSQKIKENAIFWIGEYNSKDVVNLLLSIAKGDNGRLGKKAVFSLYRIKDKKADEGLIEIAKNSNNRTIRKNAIFWLGQKAIKQSAKVLGDIVSSESDISIQKKAVFALSQIPGDAGIDRLIKIAKTHKSFKLRKNAIFWLGQSSNPKGLKTIIDILQD